MIIVFTSMQYVPITTKCFELKSHSWWGIIDTTFLIKFVSDVGRGRLFSLVTIQVSSTNKTKLLYTALKIELKYWSWQSKIYFFSKRHKWSIKTSFRCNAVNLSAEFKTQEISRNFLRCTIPIYSLLKAEAIEKGNEIIGVIIPHIIKNQFYWLKDNHMT